MNYTIENITSITRATRHGSMQTSIRFLLTDSRSLRFPEETLFFALRTKRNDGHKYIDDLYRRGVRNFVVSQMPQNFHDNFPEANFLHVEDTLKALHFLAQHHRRQFDIPVVGITGSNGKTIVKEWLYQILQSLNVTRSPRSYNSQIGVPLSLWLLDSHSQVALIEAGISMPGEMQRLADIIQPTIGVLTNLASAHQENFRSEEEKCREKLLLFSQAHTLVYPADNPVVAKVLSQDRPHANLIGWSTQNPGAPFFVESIQKSQHTTTITYRASYRPASQEASSPAVHASFTIPFIDQASIENAISCAAAALVLAVNPDQLASKTSHLQPVAMRLEVKQGRHQCTLINDTYNSDINSLDIALDFINRRPDHTGRTHTLILSDIQQSGLPPKQLYAQVAELTRQRGVHQLIGIGPDILANASLFNLPQQHFFPSLHHFTHSPLFSQLKNQVILVKGARRFAFEQLIDLMVEKVHQTTLSVDLNALVNNLNHYRSLLSPQTKLVCMIKADAYGHGAIEIAKTLQDHRVNYLAVAVADEGAQLRRAGISQDIIVMNPEPAAFNTIFHYHLQPEVYSFRLLDALIQAARQQGITAWPVHLKLDTGMHRLGFHPTQDMPQLISKLKQTNAVIPRSVFSHFVGSDSNDLDPFSTHQYQLFLNGADQLQAAFPHKIIRHICNSAAIERFPQRQLELCRLGIGLYGYNPLPAELAAAPLQPVATLTTTILQLRHVAKEDTVGYSRKGTLQRDSVIAAIPIGYADGLNRHLGQGRGYCLVNQRPAPYVGNICMDVAMIDVTDIPCQEGDTVEIFGPNLPASTLAQWLDTIPYEVLTAVSNRVKRVYVIN